MWMMGYNECRGEFNMTDSCTGRKLRPLIPRPNNTCKHLNSSDFISLNHHLASVTDQTKKEFNTQPVVVSSRWNPTPEQLRTLEELYRRGTRTPTADQIQQITAQLQRYGKIEGKNVFYWFQNHKARERQKRRRQMESCPDIDQHSCDIDIFERKESGVNRTAYEVGQTKIWVPSTNCSTLSEEVGSMQRAAKAVGAAESCRAASDGWMQFDDGELIFQHQHRKSFMEKNATWQMMQFSCPPPTHHHLINSNNITTATTSSTCTTTTNTSVAATTASTTTTILSPSPKLIKSTHDQYFNVFIAPYIEDGFISDEDGFGGESQILQLFPLRSCGGDGNNGIDENETNAAINANFTTPYQFFEFLPMKN